MTAFLPPLVSAPSAFLALLFVMVCATKSPTTPNPAQVYAALKMARPWPAGFTAPLKVAEPDFVLLKLVLPLLPSPEPRGGIAPTEDNAKGTRIVKVR